MCKQCEKKPVYEFTNQRKLCAMCFVRWFQKKVLYSIRKFEMIRSGDVVGFRKGNNLRDTVLEDVLKMFAEKAPVKIVKLPNNKVNKIAVPDTTDFVADEIVHEIVEGRVSAHPLVSLMKNKCPPTHPQGGASTSSRPKNVKLIIRPLYLFLDKEVLLYAKLRKLKFVSVPSCSRLGSGAHRSHPSAPSAQTKNARTKTLAHPEKDKLSEFIDELEEKHPEIKQAVVKGMLRIEKF